MSPKLIFETTQPFSSQTVLWLGLSLAVSAYFAGEGLRQAFGSQYVVQDDARQHVFWMERFTNSGLLPNDLSADYFQAMAPQGYAALYKLAATMFGIDPLVLNKLLPMVLGLVTTAFCFGLSMRILRVPAAAFVGSLLLNQHLWMQDDLISATPRAFIYPLILAFLYYLSRRSWLPALIALALQGLFYPSVLFISVGILILRLVSWERGRPRLSRDRRGYVFAAAGLAVSAVVLIAYALKSSGFGPVVTVDDARAMPEFSADGRLRVFYESFWDYWVSTPNTGMMTESSLLPFTICAAFLLPVLLRFPNRFPLVNKISPNIHTLGQLALASVFMFFAAHLFMFRLYLPGRYTNHTLPIVLSVAAGIALGLILHAAVHLIGKQGAGLSARKLLAIALPALTAVTLILYPGRPRDFMQLKYRVGREPRLYEFFSAQPETILVASLDRDADRIPVFSKRSNLVSWQSSLPFHKGYYSQMRQRAIDLINAQYSPDLGELQSFIRKYGIDFLLIDRRAFEPDYLLRDRWLRLFQPAAAEALNSLNEGRLPAVETLVKSCSVFQTEDQIVLDAGCILGQSSQ